MSRATTGCPIDPSSQSAQLAWLAACRPAALDRAASVLCGKDWLYFCCTGERASEPTAALAAFGSLVTGAYDPAVLDALGLQEAGRLLPEIVDERQRYGALGAFAAAAFGLLPGTPVVLGPIAEIAASLAAGLGELPDLRLHPVRRARLPRSALSALGRTCRSATATPP